MTDNRPTEHCQAFMELVAERAVRRYFDHYLTEVLPAREAQIKQDITNQINTHDDSEEAHGGVERKFNRVIWMMIGATLAGGVAGGAGGMGLASFLVKIF